MACLSVHVIVWRKSVTLATQNELYSNYGRIHHTTVVPSHSIMITVYERACGAWKPHNSSLIWPTPILFSHFTSEESLLEAAPRILGLSGCPLTTRACSGDQLSAAPPRRGRQPVVVSRLPLLPLASSPPVQLLPAAHAHRQPVPTTCHNWTNTTFPVQQQLQLENQAHGPGPGLQSGRTATLECSYLAKRNHCWNRIFSIAHLSCFVPSFKPTYSEKSWNNCMVWKFIKM